MWDKIKNRMYMGTSLLYGLKDCIVTRPPDVTYDPRHFSKKEMRGIDEIVEHVREINKL